MLQGCQGVEAQHVERIEHVVVGEKRLHEVPREGFLDLYISKGHNGSLDGIGLKEHPSGLGLVKTVFVVPTE
ncbi:MAG TPA: hypothetical protein VHS97_02900 [Isosphaeraceae bacterium]|nr:hypothetical protein [Isosphaeraceae bacterium]